MYGLELQFTRSVRSTDKALDGTLLTKKEGILMFPMITPELIDRIAQFQVRFSVLRMETLQALEGNPYQIELRRFGATIATKSLSPLLRGKNRLVGFQAVDAPYLHEMLDYFRRDGLRCTLSVPNGQMTQALFRQLVEAGLWCPGGGTVPAIVPDSNLLPSSGDIVIREAALEEKDLYLDLFVRAFAHRDEGQAEYRAFQWSEDTLPGCRRYIAEISGTPVAMASFPILDGVGFFGTAGVIPEYRRRGVQMALLQRRLADASTFGCDLVIGGGRLFSEPHRNFERAGLRLVPLNTGWADGNA